MQCGHVQIAELGVGVEHQLELHSSPSVCGSPAVFERDRQQLLALGNVAHAPVPAAGRLKVVGFHERRKQRRHLYSLWEKVGTSTLLLILYVRQHGASYRINSKQQTANSNSLHNAPKRQVDTHQHPRLADTVDGGAV